MSRPSESLDEGFHRFATRAAGVVGSPYAFLAVVIVCLVWAVTGPIFRFSDTWQLVINTASSIATFLVAFLIQNTQNRDAKAIHLKLDELLRAVDRARTGLVDLERLPDAELTRLKEEFARLRDHATAEHDAPP